MPAWKKAGKLMVSEPAGLKDMIEKETAHVLLDIRPSAEAEKGHIQGAVAAPEKALASMKEKFPSDKSAPIIIYSDKSAEAAFKTVRSWGYPNTTVLDGGLDAWKKADGKLAKGKLSAEISYVFKPKPGEISIEEFRALAEKGAPDKIILDARDNEEAANGAIKGSINIPASKIKERLAEIPKDKEIITHCTTGIRAESAYEDLKEAGFKARFLNAVIQIDRDGKFEITRK